MIFTQTRDEARVINRMCQRQRQKAGQVASYGVKHAGQELCQGDRILFTAPLRTRGIENGFGATVLTVNRASRLLTVKLDEDPSSQAKARGARQVFTLRLDDLPDNGISLFYASTTHKLQGQSVEKALILLGGRMTHRELAYVQATRGKQLTMLFADELNAGEDLTVLAHAVSRSRAKHMAHDLADRVRPDRLARDQKPSPQL